MKFLEEKIFDREQYDTYIRRIHYDDRVYPLEWTIN